jgi:hypothetical protein
VELFSRRSGTEKKLNQKEQSVVHLGRKNTWNYFLEQVEQIFLNKGTKCNSFGNKKLWK